MLTDSRDVSYLGRDGPMSYTRRLSRAVSQIKTTASAHGPASVLALWDDKSRCWWLTRLRIVMRAGPPPGSGLYLADDHQGALDALRRFCDLYETGELPEFHDIVDTIIAWSDEILAWHHTDRASNGRIEGINNLLQVLRRSAHGFTNPTNFEARGILVT